MRPARRWRRVAHPPHEALGLGEVLGLALDEDAEAHELSPDAELSAARLTADAVARPRGPASAVDVAHPARAALQVRFEQVQRAAEALVPGRRLGLEPVDEVAEVALAEETLDGRRVERPEQGVVTREPAQVEQTGRRGQVGAGQRHRVGHTDDLVTHLQSGVPERVEERLEERHRLRLGDLGVDQEDHVGVAAQGDGSPAEAPDGGEGHALRDPLAALGTLEEEPEARVEEARVRLPERQAVFTRLEPAGQGFGVTRDGRLECGRAERSRRDAAGGCGVHGENLATFHEMPRSSRRAGFPLVSFRFQSPGSR